MDGTVSRLREVGDNIILYGQDMLLALVILVAGLFAAKLIARLLRRGFERINLQKNLGATLTNIVFILMILVLLSALAHFVGMRTVVIFRILAAVGLAAVALILLLKPYLPTLPFKVGNTIETGGLLGKVEATSFLNTRMRTFDGKTVFIPNRKILDDYLTNYHITPNRRVSIKVTIGYGDDLLKAKQILLDLLKADERILEKPAPTVYVTELAENGVRLSGRGWVPNLKYWKTRCELLEKLKLAYDREGITIVYPQRVVHLYQEQESKPSEGLGGSPRTRDLGQPT